jgi:putative acetyltransferase
MIALQRTDSANGSFRLLTARLDTYLTGMNGDDHAFYDQFSKIDKLNHCVVAILDDQAVGCGAIKEFSPGLAEVKRMFTLPVHRGAGVASAVLQELERWAIELGFSACILETGKEHHDAVALYRKAGYKILPNYGQYAGIEDSVCMEKSLQAGSK